MELSIDRIRPNELALWQGVEAAETEHGSVPKDLIPVMSLERGSGSRQLRDCCDHASKHSCKGVTLTVPTRFGSRIFKFAEFSCAQKLSKSAFFSLTGRFAMHRRIARLTFPIWLYVSITGVVVFVFPKAYAY